MDSDEHISVEQWMQEHDVVMMYGEGAGLQLEIQMNDQSISSLSITWT